MFLPHQRVKVSIAGSLRDREVACSASDRHGSNFKSCVWRTVSSQSSHHPQEVLLAQFSLYVHKGGLKPDSFHFISSLALVFQATYVHGPGRIRVEPAISILSMLQPLHQRPRHTHCYVRVTNMPLCVGPTLTQCSDKVCQASATLLQH